MGVNYCFNNACELSLALKLYVFTPLFHVTQVFPNPIGTYHQSRSPLIIEILRLKPLEIKLMKPPQFKHLQSVLRDTSLSILYL